METVYADTSTHNTRVRVVGEDGRVVIDVHQSDIDGEGRRVQTVVSNHGQDEAIQVRCANVKVKGRGCVEDTPISKI